MKENLAASKMLQFRDYERLAIAFPPPHPKDWGRIGHIMSIYSISIWQVADINPVSLMSLVK